MNLITNNITSITAIFIALISMGVSLYSVRANKKSKDAEIKLAYLRDKQKQLESCLQDADDKLNKKTLNNRR